VTDDRHSLEPESPQDEIQKEIKRRRRQARWNAFLTPMITLASIVISVGFLMFFIRACQERFPTGPRFYQGPKKPFPPAG
jgi:hypothetical protein